MQALHALAMRLARPCRRVSKRRMATLAPSSGERRIAGQRLVAAPEGHLLGQVAEIPRRDALALHAGLRLGEREARGLAQALAQLAQVAAHGELALRLVDDADVHHAGAPAARPSTRRRRRGARRRRARRSRAPRSRNGTARPAASLSRNRVTCSGTGTSCVRMRFGSAFMVHATFSRIMPGTSQSTVGVVELVQERERHVDRDAVERMAGLEAVGEREGRLARSAAGAGRAPR